MKLKYIITLPIIFVLTACNIEPKQPAAPVVNKEAPHTHTEKAFSGVDFASSKDLACGMPLTAGLTDTAHYKGKIFGFCSIECKQDFVKNVKNYVKE